jgi:hypothetical protein
MMLKTSTDLERPGKKLESAVRHIYENVAAYSPRELEQMVREKLIDAKRIPPELRTEFVRRKLGLRK